jgi:hypothetical protein
MEKIISSIFHSSVEINSEKERFTQEINPRVVIFVGDCKRRGGRKKLKRGVWRKCNTVQKNEKINDYKAMYLCCRRLRLSSQEEIEKKKLTEQRGEGRRLFRNVSLLY